MYNLEENPSRVFNVLTIVLALGIHAFSTGLALASMTKESTMIGLMIGTVCHKLGESLGLGFSFAKNRISKVKTAVGLVFFSLLTPLGILLGFFIKYPQVGEAVMLAISAGILVYVAIGGIVLHEFNRNDGIFMKFFFYLIGVFLMLGIWWLEQLLD